MELWPSLSPSAAAKKNQSILDKGKGRGKAKSRSKVLRSSWTSYPVIDHGSLSAATLVKLGDELEWRTVHSMQKGSLEPHGKPSKVFPCTRAKEIKNVHTTLKHRAEQGAKFLRRFHPDVDIPLEIIEDALEQDETVEKKYEEFDPFAGNTLSAAYCFDGIKKRAIALAFPCGTLGRNLNISPLYIRPNSLLFQPRAQPVWTFDTPIRQVASSAPVVDFEEKLGRSLAVRTYGRVQIFDIRNQVTSSADSTRPPFTLSEATNIRPQDFQNPPAGGIVDMSFLPSDRTELYVVTEKGVGYQCSRREGDKIMKRLFENDSSEDGGDFWRVLGDRNPHTGTLASEKSVRKFDARVTGTSLRLLDYDDTRNVITSLCATQLDHMLCMSTTSQVIWIDERYPKQPLLGWRHHRAFDRTLSLQTLEFENTSLALLSSLKNNHITAISVGRSQDSPLQCQMPPRAVPPLFSTPIATGRVLIRHPGQPNDSFSLLELSEQGSLHHQELRYEMGTSVVSPVREYAEDRFDFRWPDDVQELERREKDLKPDFGNLSGKEVARLDLSGLYEALFGEEAREAREEREEASAEEVYEVLENMPTYWQHSDTGEEHMRTLFDIAFGSGEEPQRASRADFLTGTVLNSARGYRARKQGRIPISEVAKKSGWYADIRPIMHAISPDVFKDPAGSSSSDAENRGGDEWTGLEPYRVGREEENPDALRRETEAKEELALDLTLASHIFSAMPIRNPTLPEPAQEVASGGEEPLEDTSLLTQETEKLSLSDGKGKVKEPPHVKFGFLRPVYRKDGKKKSRRSRRSEEEEVAEESEQVSSLEKEKEKGKEKAPAPAEQEQEDREAVEGEATKMPLGVRLLLSEWTIGEDPFGYEYVDPYDLDASSSAGNTQVSSQSRTKTKARGRGRRGEERDSPESEEDADGRSAPQSRPSQSHAPPTIVAVRTLKQREKESQARTAAGDLQRSGSHVQIGSSQQSQTQAMGASTQIEPGRFGGRPPALKKPAKKRMGGF